MLIGKNHVLGIAELFQTRVNCLLDHTWWTTHQDERSLPRGREVLLDHVSSDESRAVLPAWNETEQGRSVILR